MKITAKQYESNYKLLIILSNWEDALQHEGDWASAFELRKQIAELNASFFNKLDMVNVCYSIGGRTYYKRVAKIGNKYFQHGRSMTKGNGYWGLIEIPAITDEMVSDMVSDSHYY